jgi:hypothetical protein
MYNPADFLYFVQANYGRSIDYDKTILELAGIVTKNGLLMSGNHPFKSGVNRYTFIFNRFSHSLIIDYDRHAKMFIIPINDNESVSACEILNGDNYIELKDYIINIYEYYKGGCLPLL